jgi:hypothetical protein
MVGTCQFRHVIHLYNSFEILGTCSEYLKLEMGEFQR